MKKYVVIGLALILVIGLLAGCSGIKQEDLDAAEAQVNVLQNNVISMQSQLDAADATESQIEANKNLVLSYYAGLKNGDQDILGKVFAPDFKQYASGAIPPLSIEGKVARLMGFKTAAPDMQLTVDTMIAEGDYVTAIMTVRGTHQGVFLGIPPTGKIFTIAAIEVFHIQNGKVVEQWGGPDIFDILQQINAVISAGQ